jgi:glutamate/tyrosine decarboxylase-like PLP-dependent enzyme
VPYDSGFVAVAEEGAMRASMGLSAAYLTAAEGARDSYEFVPESSRRARGFALYAALRSLGRSGVADLVERCHALAKLMASELGADPALEVINEVVINQVLVAIEADDAEAVTADAIARVQRDGTCWLGGTTWRGRPAIRVSLSNWMTTTGDVRRSAAAIRAAVSDAVREAS